MYYMTKQEIFDKVKQHLLTQKTKSVFSEGPMAGTCAYRDGRGNKCSIGCLIKGEYYRPSFEGTTVALNSLTNLGANNNLCTALKSSGVNTNDKDIMSLCTTLQRVHDHSLVEDWEEQLQELAREEGLEFKTEGTRKPPVVPSPWPPHY